MATAAASHNLPASPRIFVALCDRRRRPGLDIAAPTVGRRGRSTSHSTQSGVIRVVGELLLSSLVRADGGRVYIRLSLRSGGKGEKEKKK